MAGEVTIEVQPTPNVNALKFVTNQRVAEGRSQTFRTVEEAGASPLAAALLQIPGVVQVFFLNDFITVTRDPATTNWETIVEDAKRRIRRHFQSSTET